MCYSVCIKYYMFVKGLLKNLLSDPDRLRNIINMFNSTKTCFSFTSVVIDCCSSEHVGFYWGNDTTQGSYFQGQV